MKGNLVLIHWNPLEAQELAIPLRADGWDVDVESRDGARAGKTILTKKPDAVLIYLSRLPSHGCITAKGVRAYKGGRHIPIIFIDGKSEAVKKTMLEVPDGRFVRSRELYKMLEDLHRTVKRRKSSD
jgi:DNA-binding response OmpR family regulator